MKKNWAAGVHGVVLGLSILCSGLLIGLAVRTASPTQAVSAESCSVSSTLVNSCRPWLGGFSFRSGSLTSDIANLESRIGRQVDVVRSYFPLGKTPLNNENKTLVNRANTIVFTNYKPAVPWINAAGGDATVNTQIDAAADSIKSMSPKKIMLSLDAEPEDDVSSGVSCTTLAAKNPSGSPADYRAMWQNVRSRFDAKGVGNVVWVMNYMGYSRWDCIVKDMYPGNTLVDWVMWDPYAGNGETWDSSVSRFYNFLSSQSDGTYAFSTKTWGLAEWGSWHTNQANTYQYYADAKTSVENNHYPKLKLYSIFDSTGAADSRIDYTSAGVADAQELVNFKAFANSSSLSDTVVTPPPPPAPAPAPVPAPTPTPSPSPTAAATAESSASEPTPPSLPAGSTKLPGSNIAIGSSGSSNGESIDPNSLSGTVVLQAPVNIALAKKVEYRVDGKLIVTVTKEPFTLSLDTSQLANGSHVVRTTIYNEDGTVQNDDAKIYVDNRSGFGRLIPIEKRARITAAAAVSIPLTTSGAVGVMFATGHQQWLLSALSKSRHWISSIGGK